MPQDADKLEKPGISEPIKEPEGELAESGAEPRRGFSRPLLAMAAAALAVPALVPVLILVEPRLVPFIRPVESLSAGTIAFMVGLSVILLAANWGFLFLFYRWFEKYGRPS